MYEKSSQESMLTPPEHNFALFQIEGGPHKKTESTYDDIRCGLNPHITLFITTGVITHFH